ncbi:replication endonuclease [Glaciimonas sp. PCH181]|uniref:replication endonuclease n=1 Tax=Glaciimonas sp. PCH181 TaxID=2133943 RepID=UPI000D3C12B9|nr:replication endonuclease [Glaciimonas sp. PCH181]PUA16849.1 replication protein [Glaciimonas sp. PCH181]
MQSKRIVLPSRQRHLTFLQSDRFAPELARLPYKWRKRVINQTLDKMAWSSWHKIYESLATDFVRDFAERYVPAGVDLSQHDADIVATAKKAAAHVSCALWGATSDRHAQQIIICECAEYGIDPPEFEELKDVIGRAVNPHWWRGQLRKRIGRAFEAGNIRLGYVHYRGEAYASHDTVIARLAQNRRNALALENQKLENELGQQYTLAELAGTSTANKPIRRGELMLRISGFETIAKELGDEGLFITWTCPSHFHATLHCGKPNPKYSGATPREANDYLKKVTAQLRAALDRRGIGLYGFRIVEPHHDGTPHWHLLMFVRSTPDYKTLHVKDVASRVIRLMKRYAWRAERGEPGAFARRLKVERIDWSKGSAAAYIAKYVAKNIDGAHVGDHKTKDGYVLAPDCIGGVELVPSMRIEAWAACWGIRQFQQWGGAPVTVWRELRRIKEEMVNEAPEPMRRAWNAAQKIEGEKRADFAEYLRAQGGPLVPRKNLIITLAKDIKTFIGRYGETIKSTPYGVHCAALFGVVFKSVRHTWTPVKADASARGGAAVDLPRTRVNNCTVPEVAPPEKQPDWMIPDANCFPLDAKNALIDAWAALNACPFPRIFDERK